MIPFIFLIKANFLEAATVEKNYAKTASQEFVAQNYDEAIKAYKKHLRTHPKDFTAWNQLAAANFHTGLPRKALNIFLKVAKFTAERSYNSFYQGLCYSELDMPDEALRAFQFTSQFNDDYGSRAVFELAVIFYNKQDAIHARGYLASYLQRFPHGNYRSRATELLGQLNKGIFTENVQGVERPDQEKAVYRYSPLSLFNYPHYWYIKSSINVNMVDGFQPAGQPRGALEERSVTEYGVHTDGGIGIGPIHENKFSAWGGYNYRQYWIIDQEILDYWLKNLGDSSAFPLKTNFMERSHQFYADVRRELFKSFYLGLFGRMEYKRSGSKYFTSAEEEDLKQSFDVSSTSVVIPWIGYSWTENIRTLGYIYMRKELITNAPEFSNKSYSLKSESGSPTVSLGLTHAMEFPHIGLESTVDLFNYEFIYNDYWLDYTRTGGVVTLTYSPISRLAIAGTLGLYTDTYKLPRVRMRSCGDEVVASDSGKISNDATIESCARKDTGLLYAIKPTWYFTQNLAVSVAYTAVSNTSTKEYTEKRDLFVADIMWAFPSVKRVTRFIDRFADFAFTKDNTQ